ncbi:hypothetical protein [Labrenzia sp. R5_0]|uniref:hypothetical protein n=1 Tax=Labrenzia sp. R5_0 TaxID=2821108 RepID=UPI001ADC1928|nr:hypothetical protein [Labrenzia sp. R5_0]MBO9461160.1 hypothetical protein [Labrenzia sp. R5_0]
MQKGDLMNFNRSASDKIEDRPLPVLAPELDPSRYMSELEDFDLSEAEKIELLEVLWSVMYSFVRLGFDVKNCGQIFENFTLETQGNPDAIDSSHSDNEEKPSSKKREDASP